ncbi:hypothetical protein ES702_04457 [subsurface metagenome]
MKKEKEIKSKLIEYEELKAKITRKFDYWKNRHLIDYIKTLEWVLEK